MRRLILQDFATIDGFAADLKGEMDFQQDYVARKDEGFQADGLLFLDQVDTMLLGANTYKFFAAYWPDAPAEDGEFAERINALSKYVVSTSLKTAPWGRWEPAVIIDDNVAETVAGLKEQAGKDIVVWGSITLGHSLMRDGLVDEVQLRVCPAVLGDGKPVFASGLNLKLLEAKSYDKGLVLLRYEPV